MKLKIIYRKNLKMSTGKIAAQCVHAAIGLGIADPKISIIVLGYSDKKYNETISELFKKGINFYEVFDSGYTEIEPNTNTCFVYVEENK